MRKWFNNQKIPHRSAKHCETKSMHPYSLRAFQWYEECDMKYGLVDLSVLCNRRLYSGFFFPSILWFWKFGDIVFIFFQISSKIQKFPKISNFFKDHYYTLATSNNAWAKYGTFFLFSFKIWQFWALFLEKSFGQVAGSPSF